MEARMATRLRLAAAGVLAAAGAVATVVFAPGAAGGPAALTPDLITLAVEEEQIIVTEEGSKTLLRLTTEVANVGNGPLEVFPSAFSANCDDDGDPANDRDASQRIFDDTNGSGGFEPGADGVASEHRFGCMRYHAAHDHWHTLDFARYELRKDPSGKLVAGSRKVGFCLVDTRPVFPGPGTPQHPRYPFGSASPHVGCDQNATQGVSAGWADSYVFAVPGQQLDLTGLRRGHYCLISRADPLDLLDELNEENNVRRVRVALRPNRLSVRKLTGRCIT
jgi:Lysyl oxidase